MDKNFHLPRFKFSVLRQSRRTRLVPSINFGLAAAFKSSNQSSIQQEGKFFAPMAIKRATSIFLEISDETKKTGPQADFTNLDCVKGNVA